MELAPSNISLSVSYTDVPLSLFPLLLLPFHPESWTEVPDSGLNPFHQLLERSSLNTVITTFFVLCFLQLDRTSTYPGSNEPADV